MSAQPTGEGEKREAPHALPPLRLLVGVQIQLLAVLLGGDQERPGLIKKVIFTRTKNGQGPDGLCPF